MASETVNFTINLNGTAYSGIAQIDKALGKLNISSAKTEKLFDRLNNSSFKLNNILQASRTVFGAVKQGLDKVVDIGSESELQKMNLQTLFHGNAEAAQEMYDKIAEYGKVTPYDKAGLIDAQKTMMSFGISGDKAFESLKRIGDIAMGDKQKMQSLTLAFSQVSSAGKLSGQDLLQMINAGFNPLQAISEKTGKSMATLKEEMAKGQISVQMVEQAFIDATSKGGLFYNAIDTASQTTAGKIASMKDSIDEMLATLFVKLKPYIDNAVIWATNAIDRVVPVLSKLKGILNTIWGTIQKGITFIKEWHAVLIPLTAAIAAFTIACNVNRISLMLQDAWLNILIIKEHAVAIATNIWSGAQAVLNAIMSANPIGLIITGIAALIAIITFCATKVYGWGSLWQGVWGAAKHTFFAFVEAIKLKYTTMLNGLLMGLDKIKLGWYKFKEATGLGDSSENQKMIAQINEDIENRKKAITDAGQKVRNELLQAKGSLQSIEMGVKKSAPKGAEKTGAATKAAMGTQAAIVSGVNSNGGSMSNADNKSGAGASTAQSAEAVATGGKRNTNISINLKDLVGTINFQGSLQEKKEDVERQLAELMLRVLNMAQSSVS
ncbi:MAG: tape measure protein [Paludibacteraceae bacterium]|nr:tape measure protein [Paludibacteraceae bacterium]